MHPAYIRGCTNHLSSLILSLVAVLAQVPWAHATFSTKERARCAIVMADSSSRDGSDGSSASSSTAVAAAAGGSGKGLPSSGVFAAEPYAFYQLPSGEWWMEYYR